MKISIIIPVYNAEKYLQKCFESLEKQTYRDFEVFIVNDGSTDSSPNIIDNFVQKTQLNIKYFSKKNGGQSSARNYVLNNINGKYLTFLDSDDYLEPDYLEILIHAAEENDSDVVCSGQKKVDEKGNTLFEIKYPVGQKNNCVMRRLNFAGKLYKVEYLHKHFNGFAEGKIYEDNPFNLRMLFLSDKITFLEYMGYCQTVHSGSTTATKIQENKLPLFEIEDTIKYINERKEQVTDFQLYEFTVLSFLTYFTFEANKHHHYMKIDTSTRKSDLTVVMKVCDFSESLLKTYFPNYYENRYVHICSPKELELKQRLGTWMFVKLCRVHMLKMFAQLYYKMG